MLPTENDILKVHALITAMVVRNAMEDFHCDYLTDEQMKTLNPIIRNAIYNTALYTIHHGGDEPWCQRFAGHHMRMIPHYWEEPELLVAAQQMQNEERAREEARVTRRMRRDRKARERAT